MPNTFKKVTGTAGSTVEVPSGASSTYGYGVQTLKTTGALKSLRYTACFGIATFTPSTGKGTLLHHFPSTKLDTAYLDWLKTQLGADAATTKIYAFGGKDMKDFPQAFEDALVAKGLPAPGTWSGPRAFDAMDVTCGAGGITFAARKSGKAIPAPVQVW